MATGERELSDSSCHMADRRTLIVGLVCLDVINILDEYPLEDTDTRVQDQLWERGGNAANTCVVLAQLGVKTEFIGTMAEGALSQLMVVDLNRHRVLIDHCIYHQNCTPPTSCIIVNSSLATRTILHNNRSLPEVKYEDFALLNLMNYTWIHFEGRNFDEVLKMMERIVAYNGQFMTESHERIQISLELEKPSLKASFCKVLPKADVVFLSKDVAKESGCQNGKECVLKYSKKVKPGAVIVCAWGELGAWAMGPNGEVVHAPAFPPSKIEDTVGAGDTFNAGVIYALAKGSSTLEAITLGCQIAGDKIGHRGFQIDTNAVTK